MSDQPEALQARPCKSKDLCRGCYDDFYNSAPGGCWSYEDATVTRKKFVHIDQVPPWKNQPVWTLSCHRKQRYVVVGPEVER